MIKIQSYGRARAGKIVELGILPPLPPHASWLESILEVRVSFKGAEAAEHFRRISCTRQILGNNCRLHMSFMRKFRLRQKSDFLIKNHAYGL